MTAPVRHLDRLRAERLHGLVQTRLQGYATQPEQRANYTGLALQLPHWLRHNGLRLTLQYLDFRASPKGRDSGAARDLIDDWLESPGANYQGWHLQGYTAGGTCPSAGRDYRHASRLALLEADWLRRFVQSEDDFPVAQASPDVDADPDLAG